MASLEAEPKKKKEVVIVDGGGTALGEIPYIQHMISRTKADDMNILHRVLFDAMAPVCVPLIWCKLFMVDLWLLLFRGKNRKMINLYTVTVYTGM